MQQLEPYLNLSLQDMAWEQWRDIQDFIGYYQISSFGRIRSLKRKKKKNILLKMLTIFFKELRVPKKILKQNDTHKTNGGRKIYIVLQKGNKKSTKTISRLVFITFSNKRVGNKFVLHKNGNYQDNRIDNLYLGDRDELTKVVQKTPHRKKIKTSVYRNIHKENNGKTVRYRMTLSINGKTILENFDNELEAAKKYDYYVKKNKLNRELNFPDEV